MQPRAYVRKIKQLYLICLAAGLLGLASGGSLWAFDGDDGGVDDGGFDDEGEDHDGEEEGGHHDKDGHNDEQHGHHGRSHHHHPIYGGLGAGLGPGLGFGLWGLGFGAFGYMRPFYPSPYYAYPLAAVQPAPPPVYIQQQNSAQPSSQPPSNYWHYCQASEGYYPAVKECPDGWLQVPPQAQNDTQE